MAQSPSTVDCNQSGSDFTSDLNLALTAIGSLQAGADAPTTDLTEGKLWYDTTNGEIKSYRVATNSFDTVITQGPAGTITVGTVTTTSPVGSTVSVANSGSSGAAVFNFGLPRGARFLSGATAPADVSGALRGDWYLNTATEAFFEKTGTGVTTGDWTSRLDFTAKGITGTSYSTSTGMVTFTFNDSTTFDTGNLQGAQGASVSSITRSGNTVTVAYTGDNAPSNNTFTLDSAVIADEQITEPQLSIQGSPTNGRFLEYDDTGDNDMKWGTPASSTVDTAITDGGTNPVDSNAIFDANASQNTAIGLKANTSDTYTKTEVDTNTYTKTQVDTNTYTKAQVDTNTYTKAQVNTNTYTRAQVDTNTYTKAQVNTNTYTRAQVDSVIVAAGGSTTSGTAGLTSGNTAVAVPADATHALVWGVGGGGGGGADQGSSLGTGGGAGRVGGASFPVTASGNISVTIGVSGNSINSTSGNGGNATTFQGAGLSITCGGGSGGVNTIGGAGGTVSGDNGFGAVGKVGEPTTGTGGQDPTAPFGTFGRGAKQGAGGGAAWIAFVKNS